MQSFPVVFFKQRSTLSSDASVPTFFSYIHNVDQLYNTMKPTIGKLEKYLIDMFIACA